MRDATKVEGSEGRGRFAGATEAEHREAIRDALKDDPDGELCWWIREAQALLDEVVHRLEVERGLRRALRREVSLDDVQHKDGWGQPRCSWCMVIDPDLNEHEEGCPVRLIGWRTLTEILEDPDA